MLAGTSVPVWAPFAAHQASRRRAQGGPSDSIWGPYAVGLIFFILSMAGEGYVFFFSAYRTIAVFSTTCSNLTSYSEFVGVVGLLFGSFLALLSLIIQAKSVLPWKSYLSRKEEELLSNNEKHGVMNAPLFWPFTITEIILSAAFLVSIISASKDYGCQFAVSQTFINMAMPCIVLFMVFPLGAAASNLCLAVTKRRLMEAEYEKKQQQQQQQQPSTETTRLLGSGGGVSSAGSTQNV